ncbi:N1R/p28-like protein [Mythimna separata entomopoxvirus 'L']|uniref:N1R/p28-like protein n=1 Tax=Mythimna separata entomopoxvirus 'L' TaxID=1293572 RepID=A0A916P1T1_9POXV|nr:N1R/p28-like protein [Mythimna separata entomopoxvirus 'L']CCU56320.1 N1R/p28-like protein [Mythimna separata entomopoxvirus 'L']
MEFKLNYLSEKLKVDYDYLFGKFNKDPIDKDELLNFLNRKKRFANNDELEEFKSLITNDIKPIMNIFEFIKNNDYNIELGSWFKDIWYPLFEQKDVLITDDILVFIHYGVSEVRKLTSEKLKDYKRNFIISLKQYELEYKEIKYDDPIVYKYEYIQNDIKKISPNNLAKKTWILLTVRNFKKLILSLRTKVASDIRDYYITLEEILFDYAKYINDYNIKIKDIKEQEKIKEIENIKNKELELKNEELLKANKKSVRIDKFINNVVIKSDKLEWIYIASTDQYQQDKLYKIGSTERLHKRINGYQTGRPDAYYYVWVKNCYNSKDLDYHIQSVLKDFKYKPNKELYHGIHIDDLINIIEFIIDNHDKTLEYFYDFVKNKLENSLIKDPKIMNPLDIKSISYTIGNYTETINIEEENNNLIRQELFNFLETIENKTIIKRTDLINKLKINMNKLDIWNELKDTLKWKNGKDLIKYNNKEFYLKYY